ncbi:MAG: DUF3298 and DUF4163 domain-containing protein [Crocinitomicaceae bacterium]|jgi:hypothetical protein|nr:DUF3298 and DUF4163 domain-containing protein [Crocinitomicaceae bacterium]MDP4806639.1 DUF3298 and DUF4163 domain-containing protein [Crocinitomicaceae bacterium]MDP4955885.1 DUF3298 and DUF4163 domain-containing protein [Crocinitomicaceae bacterium]
MKLNILSTFSLALLVLFACQTPAPAKKEKPQKQAQEKLPKEEQANEASPKDTAVLISGADSILISKRKVVDKWDKEWSSVVYQFYNEANSLTKWQKAINDFIRKSLYRPMDTEPYPGPLNEALIKRSLQAFKKEARQDDITVWSMTDTFKIDDHYTTFAALRYYNAENTGGAHGMYGMGYYYFDKTTGKELKLKDLLRVDETLLKLAESVFRKTVGIGATIPFEKTEYSFGGKFYLPDNFEMTAQGIRFTYNPYEVSNWANGIVEFVLPIRQLKPYLKREI